MSWFNRLICALKGCNFHTTKVVGRDHYVLYCRTCQRCKSGKFIKIWRLDELTRKALKLEELNLDG